MGLAQHVFSALQILRYVVYLILGPQKSGDACDDGCLVALTARLR
jgi:hypothetical protein